MSRRVQTGDLAPAPDIQVNARPVDTYYRPQADAVAAPDTGNSALAQLADALKTIQPSVTKYLDTQNAEWIKQQEELGQKRIQGMTFDEATQRMKEGTLNEFNNPWYVTAAHKQYGIEAARHFAQNIAETLPTETNPDSPSISDWLRQKAKAYADQLPSHVAQSGFMERADQVMVQFEQQHAQQWGANQKASRLDSVHGNLLEEARKGIDANTPPEEVFARMRAQVPTYQNLWNLSGRETDDAMFRVAQGLLSDPKSVAEYELGRRILMDNRDGVGAIGDKREYLPHTAQLLDRAEKKLRENRQGELLQWNVVKDLQSSLGTLDVQRYIEENRLKGNPDSPEEMRRVIERNDMARLRNMQQAQEAAVRLAVRTQADEARGKLMHGLSQSAQEGGLRTTLAGGPFTIPTGEIDPVTRQPKTKTLTPDEALREWSEDYFGRQTQAIRAAAGENDLQQMERETKVVLANGVENPRWKALFGNAGTAASLLTLSNLPDAKAIPTSLSDAAHLYEQLHAVAPLAAERHVSNKHDLRFFELYRTLKEMGGDAGKPGGMSHEDAILQTAQIMKNVDDKGEFILPVWKTQSFDKALGDIADNSWLPFTNGNGLGDFEANKGEVISKINDWGRVYMAAGKSPEQAVSLAAERVRLTHTNINGALVYTGDRGLPPNFGDLVKQRLDEFAKAHDYDASDLTIRPSLNAADQWIITHKSTGFVYPSTDKPFIRLDELMTLDKKNREEAAAKAAKAAEEAVTTAYEPIWAASEGTYIGPPRLNGYSPEEKRLTEAGVKRYLERKAAKAKEDTAEQRDRASMYGTDPRAAKPPR